MHTCYSPVRRSPAKGIATLPAAPRLACVKPVASVHPEPGSNSSLLFIFFFSFQKFLIERNVCPWPSMIQFKVYLSRIFDGRLFTWEISLPLVSLYYVVAKHFNDLFIVALTPRGRRKSGAKLLLFFITAKNIALFFYFF